jgi:hypothetical protein
MTKRTSSINGHPLNCSAFRASTGLCKGKLAVPKVSKLGPEHTPKYVQSRPVIGTNTKPYRLATPSTKPDRRFPHRAHPAPTASFLVMFPNADHRRPKMKSRAQARIEKP